jgi:hypothetical protein
MALEPVKLDDLTWPALMTAVRGRIPAASKGAWTLHAPVDPGVTLLELYAYLYEQRLFWMDQATPELLRAVLALFGFSPRPALAAATVMQFTSANAATIAAGTALWLERDPSILFTTSDAVTVVPLNATRLFAGARNLTADLQYGRNAELFVDNETEVRMEFDIAQTPAVGDWLAILFVLDTHASIAPQWLPSSTSITPGATLSFLYRGAANAWKPLPEIEDGTGGLRRSGLVRFRVPGDWMANGTSYPIAIRKTKGMFTFPPLVAQLAPNVAIASHRRAAPTLPFEWTADHCRPLPGLQLALDELIDPTDPFAPGFPIEDAVTLKIRERDGQWRDWEPVLDFSFAGPRDRVFIVDRARRALLFGDGLTGRLPRPLFGSGTNVQVQYQSGGGGTGNVGARLAWNGEKSATQCDIVNLAAAEAGVETESVAAARSRVGAALRTPNRAVIEADYVSIATTTPGTAIVRAHAASGFHPCSPCVAMPGVVTVFIVPYAPRPAEADEEEEFHYAGAPMPDQGTLEAVRKRLDAARLAGTEVYVAAPRYREVRLAIDLDTPSARLEEVEALIFRGLRAFLDPLGDWPFGEPLRPAVLRRVAQQAAGTAAEIGLVSIGIDGDAPSESCREVEVGPHDLVELTEVRLRVKAAPVLSGGLR